MGGLQRQKKIIISFDRSLDCNYTVDLSTYHILILNKLQLVFKQEQREQRQKFCEIIKIRSVKGKHETFLLRKGNIRCRVF